MMPGSVCRHLKIADRLIISRLFHVTSQQPRKLQHIHFPSSLVSSLMSSFRFADPQPNRSSGHPNHSVVVATSAFGFLLTLWTRFNTHRPTAQRFTPTHF